MKYKMTLTKYEKQAFKNMVTVSHLKGNDIALSHLFDLASRQSKLEVATYDFLMSIHRNYIINGFDLMKNVSN